MTTPPNNLPKKQTPTHFTMKNPITTLLLALLVSATGLTAVKGADGIKEIEKQIKDNILKNTTVKASLLKDKTLSKCYAAEFYNVEVSAPSDYGTQKSKTVYAKTPDGITNITQPGTDAPLPELLKLVNPAFKIKTEKDALILLSTLSKIFPRLNIEEKPRVIKKGNAWQLVTGNFFKHYSGFEVETDASGKITQFSRALKLAEISVSDK
jgi:hypothetical protein